MQLFKRDKHFSIMLIAAVPLACIALLYICYLVISQFIWMDSSELDAYIITQPNQDVVRYEFSADRKRVLYIVARHEKQPLDDVDIYMWDSESNTHTYITRLSKFVSDAHSNSDPHLIASTDNDFYIFTQEAVTRIKSDNTIEVYKDFNFLSASDVISVTEAYHNTSEATINMLNVASSWRDGRPSHITYALFSLANPRIAKCCFEDEKIKIDGDGEVMNCTTPRNAQVFICTEPSPGSGDKPHASAQSVLKNPRKNITFQKPGYAAEYDRFSEHIDLKDERIKLDVYHYNCGILDPCKGQAYVLSYNYRKFIFKQKGVSFYMPYSSYFTTANGYLIWLYKNHLYALQ